MIKVYNNIIPFKGFKAVNLFGVLFIRKGCTMKEEDLNHEAIHTAQMKDTFYIFFYIFYTLEWTIRLFRKGNAYRKISFEKEAYENEKDLEYLKYRKRGAWLDYLFE